MSWAYGMGPEPDDDGVTRFSDSRDSGMYRGSGGEWRVAIDGRDVTGDPAAYHAALYDAARRATDDVLGSGTYARVNARHPDPGVQAAIERWRVEVAEGAPVIPVPAEHEDFVLELVRRRNEAIEAGRVAGPALRVTPEEYRLIAQLDGWAVDQFLEARGVEVDDPGRPVMLAIEWPWGGRR